MKRRHIESQLAEDTTVSGVPGEEYSRSQSGDTAVVINHTGYPHANSESWEHDDTGDIGNLSGCADDMLNAEAEHEGWESGYDY